MAQRFVAQEGRERAQTAIAYALNEGFSPVLRQRMEFLLLDGPDEIRAWLRAQLQERQVGEGRLLFSMDGSVPRAK